MLLPRALVLLKLLEMRGMARRMLKQMKRPAGALFVVAYICMFLPAVLSSLLMRKSPIQLSSDWILRGAPALIGCLCVMSMLAPEMRIAMNFKPAEIDVLFTGPYSRRHILTYKLMGTVLGSLFMALIFFLASFAFAPTRLPMFVGIYLSILFATMFSTAYSMLIQAVSVRVKYLGYLVAAGVFGALGYAIYTVLTDVSNTAGVQSDPALIYEFVFQHPVVRWMSMPFMPFAHVMAADGGAAAWAMWTTVSAAIVVALYVLIVLLDADYMEAAMARSAKQYATLERFKRGHFISARAAMVVAKPAPLRRIRARCVAPAHRRRARLGKTGCRAVRHLHRGRFHPAAIRRYRIRPRCVIAGVDGHSRVHLRHRYKFFPVRLSLGYRRYRRIKDPADYRAAPCRGADRRAYGPAYERLHRRRLGHGHRGRQGKHCAHHRRAGRALYGAYDCGRKPCVSPLADADGVSRQYGHSVYGPRVFRLHGKVPHFRARVRDCGGCRARMRVSPGVVGAGVCRGGVHHGN